ncbi:MAG: hypothetical protein HY560_02730 [Gemmatimonadetes bacterium]|nr:hypothetical protein [Gemmatimonadota bacterium]
MFAQVSLRAPAIAVTLWVQAAGAPVHAQAPGPDGPRAKTGGSSSVRMLGHLPLDGYFAIGGVDIEQEVSRPFVYVSGMNDKAGFTVVNVADPAKPAITYQWRFPLVEGDRGLAGENGRYFKLKSRYYYAKTVQLNVGSPHDSLGVIVFDVTGLPDPATVRQVAHIGAVGARVVHVFPYKHSDGRLLLLTTPTVGPYAQIYDAAKLLAAGAQPALLSHVPVPDEVNLKRFTRGYHDSYAAYDPALRQDRFYGAGTGGFHVYDITKPENPKFLFSMTGGSGVIAGGHTVIASPDGKYAVGTTERQYWPVFVWDLKAGLAGESRMISQPAGAFAADWRGAAHILEVRWPYVFVAAFEDGLQIFNVANPKVPKSEGWYYTCMCEHQTGWAGSVTTPGNSVMNGAADIDIRNADGLIVMTDYTSGLWSFRLEGFNGWNGKHWRMPNISTEQDWEKGPPVGPIP